MIFYGYNLEDDLLGLGFELELFRIMVWNMIFRVGQYKGNIVFHFSVNQTFYVH
jgi:hypothetical protein